MKEFVNGYLLKIVVGVGLVVLVGLVAANIWLWQSGEDSEPPSGAGQGASSGSNVPGLPSRSEDSNPSGASVNDSVELEIQREGSGSESGVIVNDSSSIFDSFRLETTGSGPGAIVDDTANVGDSAVTQVQPAPPPPSGGGPSQVAAFGDSADIVVRDSSGNIKQQEQVK